MNHTTAQTSVFQQTTDKREIITSAHLLEHQKAWK